MPGLVREGYRYGSHPGARSLILLHLLLPGKIQQVGLL
ncbi:hypothetical protein ASZ90_016627 [hydrocarbon metagenome]|uniref:Uncharacterized protein n=1 Tax=hydrocarbon metagenome TaxID=938273 RepID=A0A0W8ELI6_9ZZZZ